MRRAAAYLLTALLAAGSLAQAAEPNAELPVLLRGAVSGVRQRIAFFDPLFPDCSSPGVAVVHMVFPPQHGAAQAVLADGYSEFPASRQQYVCNLHKTPGVVLYYTGDAGFRGNDALAVSVIYPDGGRYIERYVITVEAPDHAVNVSRDGWKHV